MSHLTLKVIPSFMLSFLLHFLAFLSLIVFSPTLYRTADYMPFLEARLYRSKDISSTKILLKNKNSLRSIEKTNPKDIFEKKERNSHILKEKKSPLNGIKDNSISQESKEIDLSEPKKDSVELQKNPASHEKEDEPDSFITQKNEELVLEAQNKEIIQEEIIPEIKSVQESIKSVEDPIKTTRVQESNNLMKDKAVDSLFDRDGLGDKETEEDKHKEISSEIHNIEVIKGSEKKVIKSHSKKTKNLAQKKSPKKTQDNPALEKPIEKKVPMLQKEDIIHVKPSFPYSNSNSETFSASLNEINIESIVEETKYLKDTEKIESQKNNDSEEELLKKDLKVEPLITSETKPIPLILEPVGDLKIEIKIEDGSKKDIKARLIFKELPVKRRNRPLKRSEIRPEKIEPLIIERSQDITVLVLEKTKEGIYDLIIEVSNPTTIEANLKVREKQQDEKTKKLDIIKIDKKNTIFKLLMPEGILWDDDSYFDGYIEDSESITKFNNSSGLIWKEYKEEDK